MYTGARAMGKNAYVKAIVEAVEWKRFLSARRKNFSRRMQGLEIYYIKTDGAKTICATSLLYKTRAV